MTTAYKVLGQANPAATTLTSLYTVPSATQSIASTLSVCNMGVSTNARVAVRPAGASIDPKHYIVYDMTLGSGETLFLTVGMSLDTTDVVSVYAGHANVAFSLFGTEIA